MRYIQMNNLHRWSKSRNTLTIRYGQILITVSSSPIGPDPAWNTAVVPCRQAGNNTTGVLVDGNGRTGRLLVNLELMKAGYPPIDVKFADRISYHNAFDEYHVKHDLGVMQKLLDDAGIKLYEGGNAFGQRESSGDRREASFTSLAVTSRPSRAAIQCAYSRGYLKKPLDPPLRGGLMISLR